MDDSEHTSPWTIYIQFSFPRGLYGGVHIAYEVLFTLITVNFLNSLGIDPVYMLVILIVFLKFVELVTDAVTGAFADAFGRIRSFQMTLGLWFVALIFLGLATTEISNVSRLACMLLSIFLQGLGASLESGALEAWYINRLKKADAKSSYDWFLALSMVPYFSFGFIITALALLLFPFQSLAEGNSSSAMPAVLPLIVAVAASFISTLFLPHEQSRITKTYRNIQRKAKLKLIANFTYEYLRQVFKLVRYHPTLWGIILLRSSAYTLFFSLLFFWPLIMGSGSSHQLAPLIKSIFSITAAAAVASVVAAFFVKKPNSDRRKFLLWVCLLTGTPMILIGIIKEFELQHLYALLFILLFAYRFATRMLAPVLSGWTNYIVPNDETRATTLSVANNIASIFAVVLLSILTIGVNLAFPGGNKLYLVWLVAGIIVVAAGIMAKQIKEPTEEQFSIVKRHIDESKLRIDALHQSVTPKTS